MNNLLDICLLMELYDISANSFVPLDQLPSNLSLFNFFMNGQQLHPSTKQQLSKMIREAGKKDTTITFLRKESSNMAQNPVQKAIKIPEFSSKFNASQIQMIREIPNSIFYNKVWNFRYAIQKGGSNVSKQREQELMEQMLNDKSTWKEASLEELQAVSKNYYKMIEKSLL